MAASTMVYDIRSSDCARQTLAGLTGVPIAVWEQYVGREQEYEYTDDLILDVVKAHGRLPHSYKELQFVFFHITTSANACASFYKYGILDLKQSYSCRESELRQFLEEHGISINLDRQELIYNKQKFDISFGKCPRHGTEDYYCWLIGRKFYYDYAICGFLSVWGQTPYGGMVHRRPEILCDIDKLLKLNLSGEWISTHTTYEVVAMVSGKKLCMMDTTI